MYRCALEPAPRNQKGDTMTTTHPTSALSDRDSGVRDVLNDVYAAWKANDAEAFVARFADDATSVLPGTYSNGKDQIRAYMAAGFAGPLRGSTVIDEVKSVRFVGDAAAIVISESGVLMAGEDSVPASRLVRATWVLAERDGHWSVKAFHNSPIDR